MRGGRVFLPVNFSPSVTGSLWSLAVFLSYISVLVQGGRGGSMTCVVSCWLYAVCKVNRDGGGEEGCGEGLECVCRHCASRSQSASAPLP